MRLKYKKMIQGLKRKAKQIRRRKGDPQWSLYILRCQDGTLYTGITNNLERRVKMHNAGTASRYTRIRRPVALLYQEGCVNRAQALIQECAVKAFSKVKKEEMIFSQHRKV